MGKAVPPLAGMRVKKMAAGEARVAMRENSKNHPAFLVIGQGAHYRRAMLLSLRLGSSKHITLRRPCCLLSGVQEIIVH